MALNVSGLPRKFQIKIGAETTLIDDPNSSMSPEEVRDVLAITYPAITSSTVQGPEIKGDYVLYSIGATVGVKG